MRENKAMGIILPGSVNTAMGVLIDERTVGSIPFGGRYRLIDFILSSMAHAGIWDVGVLTRNKYESLMDHLGSGRDWDLARKGGGLSLLPPFVSHTGSGAYRGELESLFTYRKYIRDTQARYIVLSTADLVCNIDLDVIIEQHIANGADLTAVYSAVTDKQDLTDDSVLFSLDGNDRIIDVQVGAHGCGPCNRYLGLLVMKKETLLALLEEMVTHSRFTLDRDLLQGYCDKLDMRGYRLKGYCTKVQDLGSYYRASMELLKPDIRHALFAPSRPILTRVRDEVPVKFGLSSSVKNSLLADGCIIEGTVENSIIFRGVKVGKGAVVRDSILMQNTEIQSNAQLAYIIADRRCSIKAGRVLAGFASYPVVIGKESVV